MPKIGTFAGMLLFVVGACFLVAPIFFLITCKPVKKEKILTSEEITTLRDLPESHKNFIIEFTPKILKSNNKITSQRNRILWLKHQYQEVVIEGWQKLWLNMVALQYRYDADYIHLGISKNEYIKRIDSLLLRVDIIPAKLVLAQAIIESGWGRSKFSRKHHNYFGIQCYTPGCGWAPKSIENPKVWNKKFENDEECIDEYLWLLNTGITWNKFRHTRAKLRNEHKFIGSHELIKDLKRFSMIGRDYTDLISEIIHFYLPENLEAFVACYRESDLIPPPDTIRAFDADSMYIFRNLMIE